MLFFALMGHDVFMRRCLELASRGSGRVAPNPLVGSLIVRNHEILAEGYHRVYGGPHAEVNALAQIPENVSLADATLYVNLEPCAHFGKTPPCANLIVQRGIGKVVIAQRDPNKLVSGRGIRILRDANIEVVEGVLEAEARELNRRFLCFHEKKRPYIILKWAESADGFIDKDRTNSDDKGVHWISHPETKKLVHKWRSEESAILVGARTIANDNPQLNNRFYAGKSPLRIVLSPSGNLPLDAKILKDGQGALIYNGSREEEIDGVEWVKIEASRFLEESLRDMAARGISSILVEGGKQTLERFVDSGLWDESRIIKSIQVLESGLTAPKLGGRLTHEYQYGRDMIYEFRNS